MIRSAAALIACAFLSGSASAQTENASGQSAESFQYGLTNCRVALDDNPEYKLFADFSDPRWLAVRFVDERQGSGFVWYLCEFELAERPSQLAIVIPGARHGEETYLNGRLIGKSGTMDHFPFIAESRVYPVPNEVLKSERNLLSIRLSTASGYARMGQPQLRDGADIESILRSDSRARYPELVLASVFLFVAGYFYFLWWSFKNASANLYFALFSTALAVYLVARSGASFLAFPGPAQQRLEFISFFVTAPVFLRFLFAFLGRPFPRFLNIYDACIAGAVFLVAFTPDPDLWRTVLRCVQLSMLVCIAAGFWLLLREARRNAEARYLVWAFVVFFGTVVNDLLSAMRIINTPVLFLYGFVVFLLGIALILAERYVRLFDLQEQQAAVMRDLDRRKTEFLSNVSHELKTPLAELMLYAESIADGTLEGEDAIADAHEEIEKSAARLQHIVSDTVLLNLLETDKYTPQIENCDLDKSIANAVQALGPLSLKQKVSVDLVSPGNLKVQCDPSLLERALEHVIENGILYNKEGGRLTIAVRPEADGIEILVADEGAGLPAEVRDRLFEKFVRGDSSSTYAISGTGTGLALAHLALVKLSGSLRLLRTGPEGTQFSIWLRAGRQYV
jgi:signal transduction histidine kinase